RDVGAGGGQHGVHVVEEEVEVLEEPEHPEIRDDAGGHEPAAAIGPALHAAGRGVVDNRGRADQDQEPGMDVTVEEIAGGEQQDVLRAMPEAPVRRDDEQEEDEEIEAVENHGNRRARRDANSYVCRSRPWRDRWSPSS